MENGHFDCLEREVAGLLTERGLTVAAAESCTGGLLSKRLTDVPGSSRFFIGGIVAYSAQAKISMLGVDPGLIKEKGAVSREAALAMADGAREKLGAGIGVGITGIAGPDSDSSGLEVGTVFIALTTEEASFCESLHLPCEPGRDGPETKLDSPETARDAPVAELDTPEPNRDSPEAELDSPKTERDNPKTKPDSPEPVSSIPAQQRVRSVRDSIRFDASSHALDMLRKYLAS